MPNNEFYFGIRVESLENYIKTNLTELREKTLQSTDLIVHQGLKDTLVIQHEIATAIEVLKAHVSKTLNPEIEKLAQEILQANLEELKLQTVREVDLIDQKINNIEVDIRRIKITYDWPAYYKVWAGIIALCFIDTIMNYSSYQVVARNLILAILLSALTAYGLSTSAVTIGKRMQKAMTVKAKWIWFLSGIVGGGIAFFGLGLLRQTYLRDNGSLANSPFIWMLLNDFFYAIAILLAYTKLPTDAQEKEKQLKDQKLQEIEKLKAEKRHLLDKLENEVKRIHECKQKLEGFKIYRSDLFNQLDSERDHIVSNCNREFTIKSGSRSQQPPQLLIQNNQMS
ncbi:MAG: hypothetical protein IPI45_13610 [Saprospiraceae bacterium]|nr:hypothetical protein [Saprospiraceae bacterium]MBK7738804.1 hypothetical protein [Saprospiraceae bacterium]MBK7912624.1 hypothetical protein [Saprospiraceae bacterium]